MHIALAYFVLVQTVDPLLLRQRRQRTYVADLCLSAGEHSRTVDSRYQIHFCRQRTNLRQFSSVRTLVIFQDHLPDCLLLVLIDRFSQYLHPLFLLGKSFRQLLGQDADVLLAGLFVIGKDRLFHLFWRNNLPDSRKQLLRHRTAHVSAFRPLPRSSQ